MLSDGMLFCVFLNKVRGFWYWVMYREWRGMPYYSYKGWSTEAEAQQGAEQWLQRETEVAKA
jgi:hypothetical protein